MGVKRVRAWGLMAALLGLTVVGCGSGGLGGGGGNTDFLPFSGTRQWLVPSFVGQGFTGSATIVATNKSRATTPSEAELRLTTGDGRLANTLVTLQALQAGTMQGSVTTTDAKSFAVFVVFGGDGHIARLQLNGPGGITAANGYQVPDVTATASPQTVRVGETVQFGGTATAYNTTHSIAQLRWDFDGDGTDDFTGTSTTTNHSFAAAGTYMARLTAVDAAGASNSGTVQVVVNP